MADLPVLMNKVSITNGNTTTNTPLDTTFKLDMYVALSMHS